MTESLSRSEVKALELKRTLHLFTNDLVTGAIDDEEISEETLKAVKFWLSYTIRALGG